MGNARFREVLPVLPVRDVSEAVRYYTEKLGFRLLFEDVPEAPRYAGVGRGAARLHLQWHEPADFRDAVDTAMLRFLIDDVDALFTEFRDKGVFHEGTALRDTPWGTREFAFYDLDGNGLTFYRDLGGA
jgi:catechol 2,3-dioxygenase-like lactoylglutathione lyase family enzyme